MYLIHGGSMEITYDYYRIFYYVATYQSFSKAAKISLSSNSHSSHSSKTS